MSGEPRWLTDELTYEDEELAIEVHSTADYTELNVWDRNRSEGVQHIGVLLNREDLAELSAILSKHVDFRRKEWVIRDRGYLSV